MNWQKSKIQESNQLPHQNPNHICDGCEQNRVLNKTVNSIDDMAKKDEKSQVTRKSIRHMIKKKNNNKGYLPTTQRNP